MKRFYLPWVAALLLASPAAAQSFGPEGRAVDAAAWCLPQAGRTPRLPCDWTWDPVSGIGVLRTEKGERRFRDGGAYMLENGRLVPLAAATYRESGRLMVPAAALPAPASTAWMDKKGAPASAVVAPLRQMHRIIVDPGHGGHDTGAISPYGTREKDLVLEVARAVRDELVRRGLEVRMTRDSDVFIPLSERVRLANDWKADLFVSVHANAAAARTLRGFEIYTLSEETDDTQLARERAPGAKTLDLILSDLTSRENRRQAVRVAERVSGRVAGTVPVEARRLKHANFRVLKYTECPSVLIEIGYLTNRRDQARLSSPIYRRSMVDGIVGGIWTFKREFEATDGFARTA